ncbi:GmrSD restriction endonuclease domain-containing protein [Arthrobacter sp. Hor0625]|uniref:GmrSD restriction endonuclease domain-containing protein n=1 Tax=Arthrobacter sp. Hor0625 TaxID=3457358 RepID=UPI00403E4FDB
MDTRRGAAGWVACVLAGLLLVTSTGCAGSGPAAGVGKPAAPATATAATIPAAPKTATTAAAGKAAKATVPPPGQSGAAHTALKMLSTLPVKGRAPKTGYSRDQFGQAWADVDRNGCDTRNDMLRRDLTAAALKPGTQGCVVLSGTLSDPYTGTSIAFVRGAATSTAVQIDHVVALSDAWQKGAQQLAPARRVAFANDPLNLLAVDGPANMQKSDGDAATWLPPNKAFRCTYLARQIAVKAKYALWVTSAERDAMARVLGNCPATPAGPTPRPTAPKTAAAPAPAAVPPPPAAVVPARPAPVAADPAAAYYANCAAVRAAGAAPIRRGQPGYSSRLDRDGDGVGCE